MNMLLNFFLFAVWTYHATAHMSMQFPYPRDTLSGAAYAVWQQNEPMVGVHPTVCHGLDEDDTVRDGNSYAAGDVVEIDIYGSASHNGGHCAFWWTDDESGEWYKIIDVKDCTILDSFSVTMPYTMGTSCETKCTFAFTWSPVSSGACEVYMNCAEVSVSGVTGPSSSDTQIAVDFTDIADGTTACARVDETTHWTGIFGDVKDEYTEDDLNGATETETEPDVTVDDDEISDDIEEETDALCVNEDAPNIDGEISDEGFCGNNTDYRCDDGQCCSNAGYCGPELGGYYDNGTAYYYYYLNNVQSIWSSADEAFAAYCDDNQGDYRLVSCDDDDDDDSDTTDETDNACGFNGIIAFTFAITLCLWKVM